MKLIKIILAASLVFCCAQVFAATQSPTDMLRKVTNTAIAELRTAKAKLPAGKKLSVKVMHDIINKELLPYVDLNNMSRAVLGRNAWANANASERVQFKKQFTDLVINTYASALTTFDSSDITIYPVRGGYKGKDIIQVNSVVQAPGAQPLPVVYHLEKVSGKWMIFDLSVEGISLVESYKAQFAPVVQSRGLKALISSLQSHNEQLAS
jgi:phospholipid transport system substrate-binding protein